MDVPCIIDGFDFDAGLRNVLTVRTGVHVDGAAEASGDACEFVYAVKPVVDGVAGEPCKRSRAFSFDFSVAEVFDFGEKLS